MVSNPILMFAHWNDDKEGEKVELRPATLLKSVEVHQGCMCLTGIGGLSSCSCHFVCALVSCLHSDSDWNSCQRSLTCINIQTCDSSDIILGISPEWCMIYTDLLSRSMSYDDDDV